MSVSFSISLDTRRLRKKTNNYPVKLLAIHNSQPERYQTIFNLTEKEFEGLSASRVSDRMQKIRDALKLIRREAEAAAEKITPFSFADFEKQYILDNPLFHQRKYLKKALKPLDEATEAFDYSIFYDDYPILTETDLECGTIGYAYQQQIKSLLREDRVGTADSYLTSYHSFEKFSGNVTFQQVTVKFLRSYEHWMLSKGRSTATVGIYVRTLRALFNIADEEKIISKQKCYPFGKRRYVIPSPRNIKKALSLADIEKIYYYKPTCKSERMARDYWLFLYFGNGMNPFDMARLKYKNIDEDFINFYRKKTQLTDSSPKPVTVFLTKEIKGTIRRWGNKDKNPENYIFPIFEPEMTALREKKVIKLFTRFINDWMLKIQNNLGIHREITTKVARHSCATIMKRAGAGIEFIKDSLGHTTSKTTENYLDSFENEVKKAFAAELIAFKKKPDIDKVEKEAVS